MTASAGTTTERSARSEWWLLDRVALAVVLAGGAALYALIGRGSWYVDDFLNFRLAQAGPLGRYYINRTVFGHPEQGTRLLNWLLYRISPMNYPVAAAVLCAAVTLGAWMLYRILRMSFRPSPWLPVLATMALSSGIWVPVLAWWSGGVELAFTAAGGLLSIHALLRCYRGPARPLWGALAGFWVLVGLGFYERTLFAGLAGALYLPAVASRSFRPADVLRVVRRAWTGYLSLAVVGLGYLYYYASHKFVHSQPGYTHSQLVRYFWICWSHTLAPGLFGGSLRSNQVMSLAIAAPQLWWQLVCQVAFLALVVLGVRRNGWRTLIGWLVFGLLFFLPAQYAIATARLHHHGPLVGEENRYLVDLLPLLVLVLALALFRRGELARLERPEARPEPAVAAPGLPATGNSGRRRLLLPGLALAALWTVFLTTALPASHWWTSTRHVYYVANLRHDVAVRDAHGPWSMYTTYTPGDVSPSNFGSYSQSSAIAGLLVDHRISADDLTKPMYVADPKTGHLVPARFQTLATTPSWCSAAGPGSRQMMLPLSRPLAQGYYNVQLRYRVSRPSVFRFALEPDTGPAIEATGSNRSFPVSGSGALTFLLRLSSINQLRLDASTAGACVSDVRIGHPVPAG